MRTVGETADVAWDVKREGEGLAISRGDVGRWGKKEDAEEAEKCDGRALDRDDGEGGCFPELLSWGSRYWSSCSQWLSVFSFHICCIL